MLKSHRKERGFKHNVGKPPKRKGIWARCQRAVKKIGDPDTIPESRLKDRGSGHDAGELPKR